MLFRFYTDAYKSNSPGGGIGPKQKTAYEKDEQRQY